MTKSDAEAALSDILDPINRGVSQGPRPVYTFRQFVEDQYLPFNRRGWKESTAGTSEQIVTAHLIPELGDRLLQSIGREDLQKVLDRKAKTLSYSLWRISGGSSTGSSNWPFRTAASRATPPPS